MNSVYLVEAKYMDNYRVYLKFNTGESGIVDLEDLIMNYKAAEPLQDRQKFSEFFLDSWPTLAWECGFDVAPVHQE